MRLFQVTDQSTTSGATARAVSPQGKSLETPDPQRRRSFPWQPFLIGGLAFLLLTGGAILRPGNLRWLMHGDRATYLLGWLFFRNTPILQQPFGANWPYGMEMSSSIVYPDGVPLMALLLKPFNALLPEHFQYFGIWILICYMLQAFFAWKLLGRITDRVWHKVFAVLFFVLAPPFVYRLLVHFALGAHWLLLASLYLYLAPRFRSGPWILLVIVASLINPYLLAMTLLFFGAALAKHYTNGELRVAEGLKTVALTGALLLFVMWQAGYFMVSGVGQWGFGYYRASVLAFLDPLDNPSWSHFLRDQPRAPGNGAGFGFLGTGMILLSIVAAGEVLRCGLGSINWKKLWPLFLIFVFCVAYAVSNNVGVGPYLVFHYDLPPIVERFTSAFRVSGRFLWPAYYMLIAGILAIIIKQMGRRASLGLISFCVLVQVADSWQALDGIKRSYRGDHATLLRSSFWQQAASKYKKIEYVLPQNKPKKYFPLCFFAATHRIAINIAYLGRVDERRLEGARANLLQAIERGQLDPQALYVFQSAPLWGKGVLRMSPGDWAGVVDGFKVIAPAWNRETQADTAATLRDLFLENHFLEYRLGTELSFRAGAGGSQFLGDGWSQPEPWGVWSDGSNASILLLLDREPTSDVLLQLDGNGFASARSPQQQIELFVNSTRVGEITYSTQNASGPRSIRVPRELLVCRHGLVEVRFRFKNDVSPAHLGLSTGSRNLALALRTLALKPTESSSSPPPMF